MDHTFAQPWQIKCVNDLCSLLNPPLKYHEKTFKRHKPKGQRNWEWRCAYVHVPWEKDVRWGFTCQNTIYEFPWNPGLQGSKNWAQGEIGLWF